MRTRKEIITSVNQGVIRTNRYATDNQEYFAIMLEVLLDIRDKLNQDATE